MKDKKIEMQMQIQMQIQIQIQIDGVQKVIAPHPISRPDGIPDSLIISWIDTTQLMKAALSDLNSHSLLDCHSRISDRLSREKVKTQVQRIKKENHERRSVMKFLFLQGKKSKAIYGKLSGVLGEADVSLATVKR
jgi:hypothetical protein